MDTPSVTWRPMAELAIGRYAVGLLKDSEEADIYRASPHDVYNVATGQAIFASAWRAREHP